jgi:hypothetical protein
MAQVVEVPTGAIDGINATYFTSGPYQAGSLAVWLNGQEILGCYVETNPATGEFTILAPLPKAGAWGTDKLAVDYNDGSTDPDTVEVDVIACVVSEPDQILAVVQDCDVVACQVDDVPDEIQATVGDLDVVACVVQDGDQIFATVEDC